MRGKRQLKQHQEEKLQKEAAAVPSSPVEKATKEKAPAAGSPESNLGSGATHQLGKRITGKAPEEEGTESPGKDAAVSPGKQAAQLSERRAKSKAGGGGQEVLQRACCEERADGCSFPPWISLPPLCDFWAPLLHLLGKSLPCGKAPGQWWCGCAGQMWSAERIRVMESFPLAKIIQSKLSNPC